MTPPMPTPFKPRLLLATALFAGLLAGCSGARPDWHQAGISPEQTERDWNECRRDADDQADSGGGMGVSMGLGSSGSPTGTADRQRAAALVKKYRDGCMRAKGYLPGKAKP